ncbi:unnamed protein product [[Candida] boidinii]|nr:unnamed protein product [[Candida] boidinii]GMF82943.1 unnamed protein product [[Candida] boidinii]
MLLYFFTLIEEDLEDKLPLPIALEPTPVLDGDLELKPSEALSDLTGEFSVLDLSSSSNFLEKLESKLSSSP